MAAALAVIITISLAYSWPIQDDYHPLNQDWNGCSDLVNGAQNITMLFSYERPLPHRRSLLAIIGPSIEFSTQESSKIHEFLSDGGIVLLADDFGTGNSLLQGLNVSARFSGKGLSDLYYYEKQPSFPLIYNFAPSQVTANVTSLILNRPSYIELQNNSANVTQLASSSPFSFIDQNGSNKPSPNETLDSYLIMADASVGGGELILISDPSMFNNQMISLHDNRRLFMNLLEMSDGSLVFDLAHLQKAPLTDWRTTLKVGLHSARTGFLRSPGIPYAAATLSALAVAAFFLYSVKAPKRKHRKSSDN